jgi:hypothetical protein
VLRTRGARGGFVPFRTLDARGDADKRLGPRSQARVAHFQKFPYLFIGSSPNPSAERRNDMERKFLECDGASILQKERLLKYLFHSSFFRPLRRAEAFPSSCVVVTL